MVHINVAESWRSEEAAFEVLFLQDTHTSRGFHDNFSLRSSALCRRTSRRSLSYSFTHFPHSFRVSHGTWTGSRWIFEKMGAAWVRRLKAWVAARGGFFREAQRWQTASCRSKTQRKTRHSTRHLTLQGTRHRHGQHLPSQNGPTLILKWALDPILAFQKS